MKCYSKMMGLVCVWCAVHDSWEHSSVPDIDKILINCSFGLLHPQRNKFFFCHT
jgi:hypothetical protein